MSGLFFRPVHRRFEDFTDTRRLARSSELLIATCKVQTAEKQTLPIQGHVSIAKLLLAERIAAFGTMKAASCQIHFWSRAWMIKAREWVVMTSRLAKAQI